MTKNPFPGVNKTPIIDRHGKARWRFRKNGIDAYLPGPYGSIAFRAAFEAALEGAKAPQARSSSPHGTLGWLMEQYLRHPKYHNLSDSRRATIRRELDWLRGVAGDLPFARLGVRHVEALMAKKSGPTAANTVRKNLSMLFNFAIKKLELSVKNPTAGADRRAENPDGYHTWTEGEIAQFLAHHGPGTKARLALLLILNTGAARQDLAALGRQNVKDGVISYRRGKTKIGGSYTILAELAEELASVPADQMLFITHTRGRPYKATTFGNWFKDQCRDAGLPHCSAHGARKGQATQIADHEGNSYQVMAFLAHATPKQGDTYVKKANRQKLADAGLSRVTGSKPEQTLSNPVERLDKTNPQPTERKAKK